jgi:hypothetical protein
MNCRDILTLALLTSRTSKIGIESLNPSAKHPPIETGGFFNIYAQRLRIRNAADNAGGDGRSCRLDRPGATATTHPKPKSATVEYDPDRPAAKYPQSEKTIGMNINDRVILPSGKQGVILPPGWLMPNHELILLDDGSKRWVLRQILSPAPDHIVAVGKMVTHSFRKTA